jgi:hypothetical protein
VIEAEKRQVEIINVINNHAQSLDQVRNTVLFNALKVSALCEKLGVNETDLDRAIEEKVKIEVEKANQKEPSNEETNELSN